MLTQINITIGLAIYIIYLSMDFDRTCTLWELRSIIAIMGLLALVVLVVNTIFFVWTCVLIYQVWFDPQPTTINQVANLLTICLINLWVEHMITGKL